MKARGVPAAHTISDEERSKIRRLAESLVPPYRPEAYDAFVAGCHSAAAQLPASVLRWREEAKLSRVGLLRNLPIDQDMPATPVVKYGADDLSMFSDAVIGIVSCLFGTVYTIQGKGTGRHIGNMFPLPGDEYTQLASSSKVDLAWHTEEAFHPVRPSWLSIFCLRGDPDVRTSVACARDLRLPSETVRILRESWFKVRIDETYSIEASLPYVSTAVLDGPLDDPEITLDPAYTILEDDEKARAVAAVEAASCDVQQRFTLTAGDLLILDNRRVLHARSAYEARMDGTDRWLKRAFVLDDPALRSRLRGGVIAFEPS